jgi:hypothetical protein
MEMNPGKAKPKKELRDEFAMAALAGAMASMPYADDPTHQNLVTMCYALADAMLEAREEDA